MKSFTLLFCLWTTLLCGQNQSENFVRHFEVGAFHSAEWSSTFTRNNGFFGTSNRPDHKMSYGYASGIQGSFYLKENFAMRAFLNYAQRNFTSLYNTTIFSGTTTTTIDENLRTSYNAIELGFGILFASPKAKNLFFTAGGGLSNALNHEVKSSFEGSFLATDDEFFSSSGPLGQTPLFLHLGAHYTLYETKVMRLFCEGSFKMDAFNRGGGFNNAQFFVWGINVGGSIKLYGY